MRAHGRVVALFLALLALSATPAAWQQATPPPTGQVTSADISRLETTATEIERAITSLKKSDPTLAGELQRSIDDVRDEITYFRVKMRREGSAGRQEFDAVRDRLETLRLKVRGDRKGPPDEVTQIVTVSVDTQLDVRLQTHLNSGTSRVEQRFEATTIVDYEVGRDVVIPAGSVVRGFVSSVKPAGRVDRKGSITLSFDELRIENRSYRLRASVVHAMEGKQSEDLTRIGAGAVVGGILGGIIGGAKGAAIGVILGGGGAIAATEGSDVDLPVGTILRIRFDQPVDIIR